MTAANIRKSASLPGGSSESTQPEANADEFIDAPGAPRRAVLAYIILAHGDLGQLPRLVDRLDSASASFFIHIDRNTDAEAPSNRTVVDHLRARGNVHLLDRLPCGWGHWNLVAASLQGISAALALSPRPSHIVLLSGQDYPLLPTEQIERFFGAAEGGSWVWCRPLPDYEWFPDGGMFRLHGQFPPLGLAPYRGSQWWALSSECAAYVASFVREHEEVVQFFQGARIPDELFVQTVIMNAPFRESVVLDNIHYIDWGATPAVNHPRVLGADDFARMVGSGKLFARKFDVAHDAAILDMLDQHISLESAAHAEVAEIVGDAVDPSDVNDVRVPVPNANSTRTLVLPTFRPAADYLLDRSYRSRRSAAWVRVDDSDVGPILTDPDDTVVGHWLRTSKTWEPGEGRFLRQVLCPGMNAIDVGANLGYFTVCMSQLVGPAGRVLAIEADPETFALLQANVALAQLANVEALPVAANRSPGLINIERESSNVGGTMFSMEPVGKHVLPVQAVRLDDVLDPETRVDFVKVDIEGMDHAAVVGLDRTIRQWHPTILVELNPAKVRSFGESPEAVFRIYRELGLEIRVLGGDALRLQRSTGMAIDHLLLDNLIVSPDIEADLIERTWQIHFINLILLPRRDCRHYMRNKTG